MAQADLITSAPILTPEMFGAAGDGVANDTGAFTRLGAALSAAGGGTIELGAHRTYVVGRNRTPGPASSVLDLRELSRHLTINGNGARLRTVGGARYGAFDPLTGDPSGVPSFDERWKIAPYWAMISLRDCTAPLVIRDLELDGNSPDLKIGGRWGDGGWQVPGSGLYLLDNCAGEHIDNVWSHHQPLDGVVISGRMGSAAKSRITHLHCSFNGRQGLSFTGGQHYTFALCHFENTGASALSSAPGAGVDLEAEDGKTIRDVSFFSCRFADNAGSGLGADTGDIADVYFAECQFVGSRNWSAWPRKPGFVFERCGFAGAVVHAYPSADPTRACRFLNCRFTDDGARSSGGRLYFSGGASGAVVDLDDSRNVLFQSCNFDLRDQGVLPWTTRALYRDCQMRQRSRTLAMTRGKYLGRTVIDGPVSLYGSMIIGNVLLNGKVQPKGPVGSDFTPW